MAAGNSRCFGLVQIEEEFPLVLYLSCFVCSLQVNSVASLPALLHCKFCNVKSRIKCRVFVVVTTSSSPLTKCSLSYNSTPPTTSFNHLRMARHNGRRSSTSISGKRAGIQLQRTQVTQETDAQRQGHQRNASSHGQGQTYPVFEGVQEASLLHSGLRRLKAQPRPQCAQTRCVDTQCVGVQV